MFHGFNEYSQCNPSIQSSSGKRAIQISCGLFHSGILFDDGSVDLFGNRCKGQCKTELLPSNLKIIQISCGGYHTAFIFEDGSYKIIGNNDQGQCNV